MPFELLLSKIPPPLAPDRRPTLEDDEASQHQLTTRWLNGMKQMVQGTTEGMCRALVSLKEEFCQRLQNSKKLLGRGQHVFLPQKHFS